MEKKIKKSKTVTKDKKGLVQEKRQNVIIPKQLQNLEFKFVLLGKCNEWGKYEIVNGKRKLAEKKIFPFEDYNKLIEEKIWMPLGKAPFESAWQKKGYKYNDKKLINHINQGFNFGIIGGNGKLHILDIDDPKLAEEIEKILDTFAVKTGSGGRHFYFISDYNTNHVLINQLGELRAKNYQVVCVPCRHPNGNYYEIIKDVPIKEISAEDLKKLINPYLRNDTEKANSETGGQYEDKDTSRSGLEYRKVIALLKQGKSKEEIFKEMMAYTKWKESGEQYRDHQYNNALKFINSNESKEILENNRIKETKDKIQSITEDNKKEQTKIILKDIANLDDELETNELLELLVEKTKYKNKILEKILNKYKKQKRRLEFQATFENNNKLKAEIYKLLLQGDYDHATEMLCQEILKNKYIYTTRDDEKSEIWIYYDGIYIPHGKTYIKEYCRHILEEIYKPSLVNCVISKIETDTYIEAKEFFKESPVEEIPVKNGILNIFTKTLSPFTPEKRFFTKLPINYIPLTDCPLIKKFLSQIHKHEEDIIIIQELFGYCLLRDYRIEKAFMLNGGGRNGKSRLLELLKRFLGHENCVNIQLQEIEKDTFVMSEFHGKLANVSGDISKEALEHTGNFKMLTGADPITANRKFKVRLTFLNYAKLIYAANEIPKTNDLTDAFFNRWVLLEYPFKFLSQKEIDKLPLEEADISFNGKKKYNLADKEIVSKISTDEQLSGVLNWALEGLSRLLQQRDFSYSKSMADVKNLWIRKSDSFQAFCMDELEQQYDGVITKEDLRKRYSEYCKLHNIPAVGDKDIKETLTTEYGVTDSQKTTNLFPFDGTNKKVSYVWEGIKFKNGTL